ncbi:hypothetical protein SMICM304S_06264 [Streptomyces microflavus]
MQLRESVPGGPAAEPPGPSRRQRSNEPAATAPATTSNATAAGAPAATTLRATARTGRVRPLLRQLVIVEAALAVAVVGAALGGAWLVPAGVLVVLLVLLAVVRRRGRALQDWLSGALTLRARRRAATATAADVEPDAWPRSRRTSPASARTSMSTGTTARWACSATAPS